MPAHATAQVEVIKCPACKNPIVAHMTYGMTLNDDRMETITDPAEIRATDDPDERTTPAPVGAAVALDLDAARAMLNAANTIKATGGAVEIGGVRIEPCDEYGSTVTTARAEAAEAEVVTLRARLAEAEALHWKVGGACSHCSQRSDYAVAWPCETAVALADGVDWDCGQCWVCEVRAAVAEPTGQEGDQ